MKSQLNSDRSGWRFYPWNAAGWLSYRFGNRVCKIGLWFCGLGGSLDGDRGSAPMIYDEAVEIEVGAVVGAKFNESVADLIDRGLDLNERYGDDAERVFYERVVEAWKNQQRGLSR